MNALAFMHWHSCIEPSITWARFLLQIFLWRLVSVFFHSNLLTIVTCTAHIIVVNAPSVYVCINNWWPTASMLCPLSLHHKKITGTLKTKLKRPILREFPGYWWLFERNTYCVMVLGCLKKKMNNSDFRPFQVCHFKIVTTHCYYYCRLMQAL